MDVNKIRYNNKNISISQFPESDFYKLINDEIVDFNDPYSRIQYVNSYLFYGTSNLKNINLPACEKIGDRAFYLGGYKPISNVIIPKCKEIEFWAFYETKIENLYAPNLKTLGSNALCRCSMSRVSFPNLEYIADKGLGENLLEEISLPKCREVGAIPFGGPISKAYLPELKSVGYSQTTNIFGFGSALQEAYIPKMTSIPAGAFNNCTNLSIVDVHNAISIGQSAFTRCSSLTEINIPKCVHIGASAFAGCTNLSNVIINRCEKMSSHAFSNCTALRSFTFYGDTYGLSLQSSTFAGCSNLSIFKIITGDSRIHLSGGSNVFKGTPMMNSSLLGYYGSIYVPEYFVDLLKSSTNWVYFSDRITSLDNLPSNI